MVMTYLFEKNIHVTFVRSDEVQIKACTSSLQGQQQHRILKKIKMADVYVAMCPSTIVEVQKKKRRRKRRKNCRQAYFRWEKFRLYKSLHLQASWGGQSLSWLSMDKTRGVHSTGRQSRNKQPVKPTANFKSPISLTCRSLVCERKLDYMGKTQRHGEKVQTSPTRFEPGTYLLCCDTANLYKRVLRPELMLNVTLMSEF